MTDFLDYYGFEVKNVTERKIKKVRFFYQLSFFL